MLLVTFHGGKPTEDASCPVNNVYAYDETASASSPPQYVNVLSVPAGVELSELRDLAFAHGFLYVANGAKTTSNVLCFEKTPTSSSPVNTWAYVGTFASGGRGTGDVVGIDHPFSVEFSADGRTCFVSSQDSNVVTMLNVSADGKTATVQPGAAASWLEQFPGPSGNGFLDGTFVASARPALPPVPVTPAVPMEQAGLAYTTSNADGAVGDGKIQHSVRDVVTCNGVLCVVDEADGVIRLYDPSTGAYLGCSNPVGEPTHLLVRDNNLFVASGKQVWVGTPSTRVGETFALTGKIALPDTGSGMTFDSAGNFYVALRKKKQIYRYDSSGLATLFVNHLPDQPEFVVWVAGS
ncbi:hypothetical protein [Paraburkholderia sp. MM5482-R1]|uniref:hypothetical protein n=1 Tax=unclassified Paraburkholderia TaxID=2615204 RepID=UPI003D239468